MHFGGENHDFDKLIDRTFLRRWIDSCQKSAGTIKTYLRSVEMFFGFCINENNNYIDISKISNVETWIKQWKRNMWKEVKRNHHVKVAKDIARMPIPDDFLRFDMSDIVANSKQVLKNTFAKPSYQISRHEFCNIRDYLITNLIINNGSRPGAISNMTLKQFEDAHFQDKGYVVEVFRHKTDYQGPAALAISNDLHTEMFAFMKIRNALPGMNSNENDHFFTSWSGGKMSPNMVGYQFVEYFYKATGVRVNATIIRKYVTTTVHKHQPNMKSKTANLLCHSERTAAQSYALIERRENASATSEALRQVMRTDFQQMQQTKQPSSYSSSAATHRSLDDEISNVFMTNIEAMQITTAIVDEKLTNNSLLSNHFSTRNDKKKLLDKIRYKIQLKKKILHQPIVEDEAAEIKQPAIEEEAAEIDEDVLPPTPQKKPRWKLEPP